MLPHIKFLSADIERFHSEPKVAFDEESWVKRNQRDLCSGNHELYRIHAINVEIFLKLRENTGRLVLQEENIKKNHQSHQDLSTWDLEYMQRQY